MDVLLPAFYWVLGSRPWLCDFAEHCPVFGEENDDD